MLINIRFSSVFILYYTPKLNFKRTVKIKLIKVLFALKHKLKDEVSDVYTKKIFI